MMAGAAGGGGRGGDQRLGGLGFFAVSCNCCGEAQLLLQFGGKRTGQFDSGAAQHVDEKYSEFGLAARDGRSNLRRHLLWLGLCLHRLLDSEALKHLGNITPSRACRDEGDGFRIEQSFLEGLRSTNVGFGSAGTNDDAITYS